MNSLWLDSTNDLGFSSLKEDTTVEVCIVGGGITGITTSYLLSKAGISNCVLEKNLIGNHATGNTTAKITSQHGIFYHYLINTFSSELSKGYLDANEDAIQRMKQIIEEEHIDCDFESQDNYVFTNLEDDIISLKHEVLAVNSLGFPAEFVTDLPIPFPYLAGVKFPNQAQFHPLKYLYALCNIILNRGYSIYTNTKVYDVKKVENGYDVITKDHVVHAKKVVIATHYPIINAPGFYFLKMYQEASYIIGFDPGEEVTLSGMYINHKAPTISLRSALSPSGKRILLLGGSNHKVGTEDATTNCFSLLEDLAKNYFPNAQILYHWSTQDCISLDKIPYIGEFSKFTPNLYVATGFKKWGMTTSFVAANIISDSILGKENPYASVFSSTRLQPLKNSTEFVSMIKQSITSLVTEKLTFPKDTLESLKKGEGKIVTMDNTKVGVYLDDNR